MLQAAKSFIVKQYPRGVAIRVLILAAGKRPQQNRQAHKAGKQGKGNDQRHG